MSEMPDLEQLIAPGRWRVEQARSVVGFRIRHLLVETVVGRFRDFDGVIDTAESLSMAGSIRAASLETRRPEWDARLRSPEFLNAERYPELLFASTHVEVGAGGALVVAGHLTIREVTRTVELGGVFRSAATGPGGGERIAFDLRGELSRAEYGLTWNRVLEAGGILLGDVVELALGIAAVRDVAIELAA